MEGVGSVERSDVIAAVAEGTGDQETEELLDEQDEEIEEEHQAIEERLARHIQPAKSWLFASILVTLLIALIASVMADSGLIYAIIGFSPTIIAAIIFLILLEGEYRDVLFWGVPLVLAFLFLAIGPALSELMGGQLDVPVLTGLNMILSYVILAVMNRIEYWRRAEDAPIEEVTEFKAEDLDRYIHTIEDKCKALNFVIGRVYRASNGGTKGLREKLKVPSEWYNEFNSISTEEATEKKELALDLLRRIQEQLSLLLRPEKDLFSDGEVKGLRHLARNPKGRDRVLDVLSVNDNDPVQDYYLGAMDFCKRVSTELEKL